MATENSSGITVAATEVSGRTVSSMVRELTLIHKASNSSVNGMRVGEFDGSPSIAAIIPFNNQNPYDNIFLDQYIQISNK